MGGVKVNNLQTIHQRPRPRVIIKNKYGIKKLEFSVNQYKVIQSYSFSYSRNSVDGNFNITFYPDTEIETPTGVETVSFIDQIDIMDVVLFYEDDAKSHAISPVFTGVIKNKKFVGQMSESGLTRRLSVSGIGITGLVSQFYVNLDTKACVLTNSTAQNAEITKSLTMNIMNETSLQNVISKIWEHFVDISTKYANVVTIDIKDMLERFIGKSVFKYDEVLPIKYPVGCVFNGESTQDFYSVIDNIIPQPYYEKFAYMDSNGKQRIKIRVSPFNPSKWKLLSLKKINPIQIKNISIEQSDSEVYTAFYAYIANSPMEEDKMQLLTTQITGDSAADIDKDKFKTYGYRLLSAHFLGYVKPDGKDDYKTADYLNGVISDMKSWYGKIDEMYSGNISLVTTYGDQLDKFINPGDRVSVFGAEFYVDGVTHSWSFGQGGETNISVSRGGKYDNGVFKKIEGITSNLSLLERGISQ